MYSDIHKFQQSQTHFLGMADLQSAAQPHPSLQQLRNHFLVKIQANPST